MNTNKYVDFNERLYTKFFAQYANLAGKKKILGNRRKKRPRASLFPTTCDAKRTIKSDRPNVAYFGQVNNCLF